MVDGNLWSIVINGRWSLMVDGHKWSMVING